MNFETLLTILRTASLVVACFLGILGVLGNFRRKDGRLNNWGYASVFIIFISTVISISTALIEAKKEKAESLEQIGRMEKLLREVLRVGQPITQLEITYWVELSNSNPAVREYVKMLDEVIGSHEKELKNVFPRTKGLDVSSIGLNDEIVSVHIKQGSPYWPKDTKQAIGNVTELFHFNIFIRKVPIKPELFRPLFSNEMGDFDWSATALPLNKENMISMNYQDKTIEIFGSTEYKKDLWRTNGIITSIQDIYGAQLFFLPPGASDLKLPAKYNLKVDPVIKEIEKSIEIRVIVLKFSSGRQFWIDGTKFTKSAYKGGYPIFSIILPATEGELLSLAPNK